PLGQLATGQLHRGLTAHQPRGLDLRHPRIRGCEPLCQRGRWRAQTLEVLVLDVIEPSIYPTPRHAPSADVAVIPGQLHGVHAPLAPVEDRYGPHWRRRLPPRAVLIHRADHRRRVELLEELPSPLTGRPCDADAA